MNTIEICEPATGNAIMATLYILIGVALWCVFLAYRYVRDEWSRSKKAEKDRAWVKTPAEREKDQLLEHLKIDDRQMPVE